MRLKSVWAYLNPGLLSPSLRVPFAVGLGLLADP